MLYGNFEARDRTVEPHETPVIDLSGFVALFDWMTAANRFNRFGDATDLAQLLRKARPPKQRERPDAASREQSKRLSLAARSLESVSLALRLIRPGEAMHASSELPGRLLDVTQSIQSNASPFVPLVHSITEEYAPLGMHRDQQESDVAGQLERERGMINWLLERNQYAQATTIAREWIVSWVMAQVEMEDILDKERRDEVEDIMGKALRELRHRGVFDDAEFSNGKTLCSANRMSQALDIYSNLGDTRNDMLHAGKRRSPLPAQTMANKVTSLCSRLSELPLPA